MSAVTTRGHNPPRWGAGIKTCNECGRSFPRDREHWTLHPHSSDGLHGKCKPCAHAYRREWRQKRSKHMRTTSVLDHPNGYLARELADILGVATMNTEQLANETGHTCDAVVKAVRRLVESGVPVQIIGESEAWDYKGQGAPMNVYRIVYPSGRQCPDCGTYLNKYNRGPYCGVHQKEEVTE